MANKLLDHFERIAIIHLPERTDRMESLKREFQSIGGDVEAHNVTIPHAPKPSGTGGFPSRGVHGNYLSHLDILRTAVADRIESVLILEDDAIFSRRMVRDQAKLELHLRRHPWDTCFLGHSVINGLPSTPSGFLRFSGPFIWAHCYGVHRRCQAQLIEFLEQSMQREPGHAEGAKMYIDAALTFFRKTRPDLVHVLAYPALSVQKGSVSSLNTSPWYDRNSVTRGMVGTVRGIRDDLWKMGLLNIGPKGWKQPERYSEPAIEWPSSILADEASPDQRVTPDRQRSDPDHV